MLNLLDLEATVALPVTRLAPVAHLVLVLEDDDLLALDLAQHVRQDARAGDRWRTHGDVFAVADEQHVAQLDLGAGLRRHLLDLQALPRLDPILPAAGGDDCVHDPVLRQKTAKQKAARSRAARHERKLRQSHHHAARRWLVRQWRMARGIEPYVKWLEEEEEGPSGPRRVRAAWLVRNLLDELGERQELLAYLGSQPRVTAMLQEETAALYPPLAFDWEAIDRALTSPPGLTNVSALTDDELVLRLRELARER